MSRRTLASVLRSDMAFTVAPITRTVVAAYPDAVVEYRGITEQAGEHPRIVVRYLVTHADGSTSIIRFEDAVWVVTDDGAAPRMGDELAPLASVLA